MVTILGKTTSLRGSAATMIEPTATVVKVTSGSGTSSFFGAKSAGRKVTVRKFAVIVYGTIFQKEDQAKGTNHQGTSFLGTRGQERHR